jgi:REP element-mobilizing transposase RayT
LEGEVAEAAEEIIRETYKELDIGVIDMAVSVDHVHIFIKKTLLEKAFTKLLRKVLSKMFHRNASQPVEIFC